MMKVSPRKPASSKKRNLRALWPLVGVLALYGTLTFARGIGLQFGIFVVYWFCLHLAASACAYVWRRRVSVAEDGDRLV